MKLTMTFTRAIVAQAVWLASAVFALWILGLIVPFFGGQATSPVVDAFNRIAPFGVSLQGSFGEALSGANGGIGGWLGYYMLGSYGFIVAACLTLLVGDQIAHAISTVAPLATPAEEQP